MRLRLEINAIGHEIDSVDPEILGRWIVEIFDRATPFHPADLVRVHVQPSYIPDQNAPGGYRLDWIANSRYQEINDVHTPRELYRALGEQLAKVGE